MAIHDEIKQAIEGAIEGSTAEVFDGNGGGHFRLRVTSTAFDGKSLLNKQRMVLSAIKHLMAGDMAPVHAVDKIETVIPD
jgi:stress-induced morphogen